MRLTDNEKRDAIKLLQEGKPLPDKYRFLLFPDDREVELVWNGKTQDALRKTGRLGQIQAEKLESSMGVLQIGL